jgi:hypothetical protein
MSLRSDSRSVPRARPGRRGAIDLGYSAGGQFFAPGEKPGRGVARDGTDSACRRPWTSMTRDSCHPVQRTAAPPPHARANCHPMQQDRGFGARPGRGGRRLCHPVQSRRRIAVGCKEVGSGARGSTHGGMVQGTCLLTGPSPGPAPRSRIIHPCSCPVHGCAPLLQGRRPTLDAGARRPPTCTAT